MIRGGDQKEFRQLLAAVTERPLTSWEQQQLWQILGRHPEWIGEYVEHCEFAALVGGVEKEALAGVDLSTTPVIPIRRGGASERSPRSRRSLYAVTAAASAAAALVLVLGRQPHQPVMPPSAHESPQETYERVTAKLPTTGSLSRPATKFNATSAAPAGRIRFDEQIRPLLSENCFACHGPGEQKSGLRLDTFAGATADLGGYAAIVPGKPDASEAIKRIETTIADDLMPPADSHKTLKPAEKALLRRWIAEGAAYQQHWSFEPPRRPPLPPGASDRNPIDAFVQARLRARGLEMNPPAARHELARRAALDVLGMPASPAQVKAFVDDAAPDAYDRYLDALFQSPHYGEHQARHWLDAVRYGDTHGMHLDNYREIWPYRDWVVQAFNQNMPFDRFVTEQLAGDLLPGATEAQRIATGFGRCNISTSEGGSIVEEVETRYLVDRTETFSTVFLGMTAVCASCHDHKYDPISQKDFYALGAFFNNTTQPAMDGNRKDSAPVLVLPSQSDRPRWQRLLETRRQLGEQMARRRQELAASGAFSAWQTRVKVSPAHPVATDALTLWMPLESASQGRVEYWVGGQKRSTPLPDGAKQAEGAPTGRGLLFQKAPLKLPRTLSLALDRPFTISVWVKAPDQVKGNLLLGAPELKLPPARKKPAADEGEAKPTRYRPFRLSLNQDGSVQTALQKDHKVLRATLPSEAGIPPGKWHHVVVRYSGSGSESGFTYVVDGQSRDTRSEKSKDLLQGRWAAKIPLEIGAGGESLGMSDLRVFSRYLTDEEVTLLGRVHERAPLPQASKDVLETYHANVVDAAYRRLARKLAGTQAERDAIASRSVTTLVMEERADRSPRAWLLDRGEYDKRKQELEPAVFSVLPPLPRDAPRNRLGLARWLMMRENPLTARVTVNRLWQQLFGVGLVRTTEDFGTMGERPSHPELLDWLAVELMESGWDVKRLLRLMLTSATYRQSSKATPQKLVVDPENRLLARGPRVRLDAEVLRDQALAASGLLVPELGGPPVKPYQPPGLWKVVAFVGSNTADFVQDHGPKLYRRSLYTFWKRTSPPPSMTAFDAPSRESCTVRRERTNTPLQALVLMNDPQFVEAARHLATVALREHDDDEARATEIWKRVRGTPADRPALAGLLEAARTYRQHFATSPAAAHALIAVGESGRDPELDAVELATWTMVGNTVFNRDDVINKN